MSNKGRRINGDRGITLSGQFGNGPLPNWILNTHPYIGTFLTQGLKPTDVVL